MKKMKLFAGAVAVILFSMPMLDTGCTLFEPPKCKDPKATWWDCKLTWRSNQTESDQTAKAWICATSLSTIEQAALDAGLACAVPPDKSAKIKCIDSHSNSQPAKPLQSFSPASGLKPENIGDPACNECLHTNCSQEAAFCAQNNLCTCLFNCQATQAKQGITVDPNSCPACSQFGAPPPDPTSDVYETFAQCSRDFCDSVCFGATTPPANECCKNIHCTIE